MLKNILSVLVAGTAILASSANAQEVYWKKQNVNIQITRSESQVATYSQLFQKMVLIHNYYECGYYQEPEILVRPGTCYELKCEGGAGRSPNWDAFYSAKKAEKASKLAKAIKGIGKSSADALVDGGSFSTKPRSWEAFKSEINSAANSGAISQQVKTLVLSTYRADNMSNLGYASGNCHDTVYSCDEVTVLREGQYISQQCDEPRESLVDSKLMNYSFQIKGAVLLPSETEALRLSLSGSPEEMTLGATEYNNYSSQILSAGENQVVVAINGTGRKQVDLPRTSIQSVSLIPANRSSVTLQISVAAAALPAQGSEQLIAAYEVRTCKIGFFGTCGIGWDKKESFIGQVTGVVTSFGAPITIQPGSKGIRMEVEVKVYKQNSIYHNARPVIQTTEKLTLD